MKPYLALPRPWLVAHRGGAALAPENTLPAFDLAARLGADAFELDVHLTSDGEVVVFHDDETARLTGEPGTVEARTLAEVRALDAGHGFTTDGGTTYPWRGKGVHPPTLGELFTRYPATRMNVEAKSADPALAAALVAAVRRAGAIDGVCIGSQHDDQAERLRALLPEACHFLPESAATALVMAARAEDPTGLPEGWDVADLPDRLEGTDLIVLDRPTIAFLHGRGLAVFAWTVDEERDMRRLLADGIDGVMTDRPDVLARVLGR
ncbi:MAG: glycerophosphodiester phosphodiesterase [Anaeromyxobacteraceae bacterium]